MNLNNSLRRTPVVGRPLSALLSAKTGRKRRLIGLAVYSNAVTADSGPYSVTLWPGGRGVDRTEKIDRGPGDWHRTIVRNTRFGLVHLGIDRSPNWRQQYR